MWPLLLAGHLWCESCHLDPGSHSLACSFNICHSPISEVHILSLLPILTLGILQSDSLLRILTSPWDALNLSSSLHIASGCDLFCKAAEPSPRHCPQLLLQCHIGHMAFSKGFAAPFNKTPLLPDFSTTYMCFLSLRFPIFCSPRARYKGIGCLALSQESISISSFIPPPVC